MSYRYRETRRFTQYLKDTGKYDLVRRYWKSANEKHTYTDKDIPLEVFIITFYYSENKLNIPRKFYRFINRYLSTALRKDEITETDIKEMIDSVIAKYEIKEHVKFVKYKEIIEDYLTHNEENEDNSETEEKRRFLKFRTNTDKAIRRMNLKQLLDYMNKMKIEIADIDVSEEIDYITFTNIILAYVMVRDERFLVLMKYSLNDFIDLTKKITSKLKTLYKVNDRAGDYRAKWVEATSLTGFRNSPFSDYDQEGDLIKLAESGRLSHRIDKTEVINDGKNYYCDPVLKENFKKVVENTDIQSQKIDDFSLYDWVISGKWMRTGSAEMDHFQVEYEGKTIRIKHRKNTLWFTYTPEELYNYVITGAEEIKGYAVEKNELSKIRTAVLVDLRSYIIESYLFSFNENWYEYNSYYAFHHSADEEYEFNSELRKKLKGNFAVSYDFSEYDHQPTYGENIAMIEVITDYLKENIYQNLKNKEDYYWAINWLKKAEGNMTLAIKKGDKEYQVNGGILSGRRITTKQGCLYSAASLLMTGDGEQKSKGDDVVKICSTDSECIKTILIMAAYGWKSVAGKFGIAFEGCEFLRNYYSPEKVNNYLLRAVPIVVQHRPWQPEPADIAQKMATIGQQIEICKCRGGIYSTKKHLDIIARDYRHLLNIPYNFGGMGVFEWDGENYITKNFRNDETEISIMEKGIKYPEIKMTESEADKVAELNRYPLQEFKPKNKDYLEYKTQRAITSDDIYKVQAIYKSNMRDYYKRSFKNLTKSDTRGFLTSNALTTIDWYVKNYYKGINENRLEYVRANKNFGSEKHNQGYYEQMRIMNKMLEKEDRLANADLRRMTSPRFNYGVLYMHSLGLTIEQAEDWMFGKIPVPSYIPAKLIPILYDLVSEHIITIFQNTVTRLSDDEAMKAQIFMIISMNMIAQIYESNKLIFSRYFVI